MAENDQDRPTADSLSEAFADLCKRLGGYSPNTVAQQIGTDRKTARNAIDGKAGVPVITKALKARQKANDDHFELWLALGQMIFGESLDQYEERKLRHIIESTENARTLASARASRRRALEQRALTVARTWNDEAGGQPQRMG